MVTIRAACPDDAGAIAVIRAQSWRAAYDGVIPAGILARLTGPRSVALNSEAIRRERWTGMIVAETADKATARAGTAGGAGAGDDARAGAGGRAVAFASFGPERGADGQLGPAPGPGQEESRAELYAIYAVPAQWSTGAGRALMDAVLERTRAAGYASISLWVLQDNPRARRFYERAGFCLTADSQVLEDLGDVTEVRYERPLG
jgi:ribosomal protein S18 acetylase RimI-like enzyme